MKKQSTAQFALIVATAMMGLAQAKAETITVTSQFTPMEDLSVAERAAICQKASETAVQQFDCDKVIMGKNEDGNIELREKGTMKLQALTQPTCSRSM